MGNKIFKYVTISPLYLLVGLISLVPSVYAIVLSFTNKTLFSQSWQFIGVQNYVSVLNDPEFWLAVKNNVIYGGTTTLLQVGLGLVISLLLIRPFKGSYVARGLIVFPYLVPTIVAVLTFEWIFDDLYGIANTLLVSLGVGKISWLGPSLAMFTVILVSVWRFLPFAVLLIMPGLQAIPDSHYEAAKLDGASPFQQFWHITFPQLRSVLYIVALLRGIWMFNNFNLIWIMTQGGPVKKTMHIPILSYTQAFRQFEIGKGSAVAVAGFSFLIVFIVLYFRSTS